MLFPINFFSDVVSIVPSLWGYIMHLLSEIKYLRSRLELANQTIATLQASNSELARDVHKARRVANAAKSLHSDLQRLYQDLKVLHYSDIDQQIEKAWERFSSADHDRVISYGCYSSYDTIHELIDGLVDMAEKIEELETEKEELEERIEELEDREPGYDIHSSNNEGYDFIFRYRDPNGNAHTLKCYQGTICFEINGEYCRDDISQDVVMPLSNYKLMAKITQWFADYHNATLKCSPNTPEKGRLYSRFGWEGDPNGVMTLTPNR